MQGRIMCLAVLHSCQKLFILEEIAILDLFCDSCQFLIYDTACAHVQVAHLRVAHLALRQSHCQAAGITLYKGILFFQGIHHRGLGQSNRIALCFITESVSVQNH